MNIVQLILDQALGGGLGQLSSLLGEGEGKTESAVRAAAPTLLAGLARLAGTSDGAQKLVSALGKVDSGTLGNLGSLMSGDPGEMVEKGSSLLTTLLGNNALTGLINALTNYSGLGGNGTKTLLGYLAPIVLGMIAKQFTGKAISAQGLSELFAGQKANIANALPSGLSLADVPGFGHAGPTNGPSYATTNKVATKGLELSPSPLKWALPLAALAALVLGAFLFWPKSAPPEREVVPTVHEEPIPPANPTTTDVVAAENPLAITNTVTKDLSGDFASLTDTLGRIKDVASAEAALPTLYDLSGKLDGLQAMVAKLPAGGRGPINALVASAQGKLVDQLNRVLMIPGVGEKLRPVLEMIVDRISSVGGLPAGKLALPSSEVTSVGSGLSGVIWTLTETLSGIKDTASADAAMPKLASISSQLETTRDALDRLPGDGKVTIASMASTAVTNLKALVARVEANAGVGEKLKPMIDQIMNKLAALAS
jgi:hypothetical protein